MPLKRALERIGLTDNEALVYLASLELGNAVVKDIAAKAGLSRPIVFIILESLVKRGLATSVNEGDQIFYAAEHPRQLELILQKERTKLREQEATLADVIPELASLFHQADRHPIVKIYTGPDGARAMDRDGERNQKKGQLSYSFTALDLLEDMNRDYVGHYAEKRLKVRQPLRVIYTHKDGPRDSMDDPSLMREAIFVPRKIYPFEGSIVIRPWFGLRIFSHRKDEFIGITIESQELARTMQAIFDLNWMLLKKDGMDNKVQPK